MLCVFRGKKIRDEFIITKQRDCPSSASASDPLIHTQDGRKADNGLHVELARRAAAAPAAHARGGPGHVAIIDRVLRMARERVEVGRLCSEAECRMQRE